MPILRCLHLDERDALSPKSEMDLIQSLTMYKQHGIGQLCKPTGRVDFIDAWNGFRYRHTGCLLLSRKELAIEKKREEKSR
jgi:hypothetical protein